MINRDYPWISRQAATEIYQKILAKPAGVHIYLVKAPAGGGKTYLARDIGTRLGSVLGYEAGHKDDIYWSGIVDLYDPDTSSSRYIESAWKQAFSSLTGAEFLKYENQLRTYKTKQKEIVMGPEMENQLTAVLEAFAEGMETVARTRYPVMAFDTVERLRSVLDPVQDEIDIKDIETPDVFEWLFHQIERLPRGIVLLMGRPAAGLEEELKRNAEKADRKRNMNGLQPVVFHPIPLEYLDPDECNDFFDRRIERHPNLRKLLDPVSTLLTTRSHGNPLLLDIALQTLLETNSAQTVCVALESLPKEGSGQTEQNMQAVENALLSTYKNAGSPEIVVLLEYLAVTRNGLFDRLLQHLDPTHFSALSEILKKMGDMPFVKVRDIAARLPGQAQRATQRTYFLHDAMYAICDRVNLTGMSRVVDDSRKIAAWYDDQIQQHMASSGSERSDLYNDAITGLLVESLPYRMRSDPQAGYAWYLEQSDLAIRSISRGRDSRLRDAMAQFIGSAGEPGTTGELPANAIDGEILGDKASDLYENFKMDSALQWVKRCSIWGKHEKALQIAQKADWVKKNYEADPERYLITYTEFLLWQGQSLMYLGQSAKALEVYNQALNAIEKRFPLAEIKRIAKSKEMTASQISEICLIIGRLYNNRGYVFWVYLGQYRSAIEEFVEAIHYFETINGLDEEIANSKDNIGRVYAHLGYSYQAFEMIQAGLNLRIGKDLAYREALSRISLAIALIRFGNTPESLQEVKNALNILQRIQHDRGIALAKIARGMAFRTKGEQARELSRGADECLEYIEKAITDLSDALKVFPDSIRELIREVQAYNELACCYRTQYLLYKKQEDWENQGKAFDRGIGYFTLATEKAREYGFLIEQLDSLQDRAVLYARADQFDKAREDLESVRRLIPDNHKILENSGLSSLEEGIDQVDAYYKLMGQVELLTGATLYNDATQKSAEKPDHETILKMTEHYILAIAYFDAFSGQAFANSQTNDRLYFRLRGYSPDFLIELRDNYIPACIKKYNLPHQLIGSQMDDVFNLLIPGSQGQSWEKFAHR